MNLKEQVINFAKKHDKFKVADFIIFKKSLYSRQYISKIINELVDEKKLIKSGATAKALYALPDNAEALGVVAKLTLANKDLEEHRVIEKIERQIPFIFKLKENTRSIFDYAFSEMLNNAIEHSKSKSISIEVGKNRGTLSFKIRDFGIGVFRNVMSNRKLKNELEAIQDLLKGKTTTAPKAHSGEGIFFTSKTADVFILESYDYVLVVNNVVNDVFFSKSRGRTKKGTSVTFEIQLGSDKHLIDIFQKFQTDGENLAFDKTEIQIKLYTLGTVYISRSQARRVLTNLEKFKSIVFDFDKVPMIGQAFADEIFRVFKNKYPKSKIEAVNMSEAVEFMIKRVGR
jgi:anti-sigma regulatory factor (Ser/Thr protein kinase)